MYCSFLNFLYVLLIFKHCAYNLIKAKLKEFLILIKQINLIINSKHYL